MSISAEVVRHLREETGAGMMDCKSALVEAQGDMEKAREFLRKKGLAAAAKKASRAATDGAVGSSIVDGGRAGVIVEVNCETDFVAKTDDFKNFVKDLCMQVAAANPLYVSRDQVPEADLAKERDIAMAQLAGKPPAAVQKIVEGKLEKYYSQVCLLDQPFVKNPDKMIKDVLTEIIAVMGENMQIRRFVRFQLGA